MLTFHAVSIERKHRLVFARTEWFNSDNFRSTGHRRWEPSSLEQNVFLSLFSLLRSVDEVYALITEPFTAGIAYDSMRAVTMLLRMNAHFAPWTSMIVDEDVVAKLGFFFQRKEDAVMFQMVWPS